MSLFGDLLNLGVNIYSATAANKAAQSQANAITQASQTAAKAGEFKPYSITSGFGESYFNPLTQRAGYAINPVLEAYRNKLYSLGAGAIGGVNIDPTQATQQYLQQQTAFMAPQRQAEDIAMRQRALQSGRIGLGVSSEAVGAGPGGMVNPDQYALNLARARADQEMALKARALAQQDIDTQLTRGQGLFTSGFGTEELAMKPLNIGAQMGGMAMSPSAASALLQGGIGASQANLEAANIRNAALSQGINKMMGMFSQTQPTQQTGSPYYGSGGWL